MSEAEPIHINILYKHKQSQGAIFESPLIFLFVIKYGNFINMAVYIILCLL